MPKQHSNSDPHVTSNSGNDEHGTPPEFIRKLKSALPDGFDLDPCSGAEPQQIADTRYTKEDNGLAQKWFGNVYVNPPYSALLPWFKKIVRETKRTNLILALVPAYTSTQWFQQYATQADYLTLIEGRMSFVGSDNTATFPSALLAFGNVPESLVETFETLGTVIHQSNTQRY